jgi:hypothetical protein
MKALPNMDKIGAMELAVACIGASPRTPITSLIRYFYVRRFANAI